MSRTLLNRLNIKFRYLFLCKVGGVFTFKTLCIRDIKKLRTYNVFIIYLNIKLFWLQTIFSCFAWRSFSFSGNCVHLLNSPIFREISLCMEFPHQLLARVEFLPPFYLFNKLCLTLSYSSKINSYLLYLLRGFLRP